MSSKRYPEEFKIEAAMPWPMLPVASASCSTVSTNGSSATACPRASDLRSELQGQSAEIRRLNKELTRITEERDILKKTAAYVAKESR